MNKHESFERLRLMQKLVKAKLYDELEEVIDDAVWETASDDWKRRQLDKANAEKERT